MQRALRLNGQSVSLWVEYTHLELLYLTKIAERQRVLGIGAASAPPSAATLATVEVPALDAEAGLGDSDALAQVLSGVRGRCSSQRGAVADACARARVRGAQMMDTMTFQP